MADDDHVGLQRLDILGGVAQRLAFGRRGAGAIEGDDIRAEPLGGHVEGHAGARARFEEEIDDSLAAQGGDLLHGATKDLLERRGGGVDLVDLLNGELLERDQVAAGPGHAKREGGGRFRLWPG